jgi:hypothetical protein
MPTICFLVILSSYPSLSSLPVDVLDHRFVAPLCDFCLNYLGMPPCATKSSPSAVPRFLVYNPTPICPNIIRCCTILPIFTTVLLLLGVTLGVARSFTNSRGNQDEGECEEGRMKSMDSHAKNSMNTRTHTKTRYKPMAHAGGNRSNTIPGIGVGQDTLPRPTSGVRGLMRSSLHRQSKRWGIIGAPCQGA